MITTMMIMIMIKRNDIKKKRRKRSTNIIIIIMIIMVAEIVATVMTEHVQFRHAEPSVGEHSAQRKATVKEEVLGFDEVVVAGETDLEVTVVVVGHGNDQEPSTATTHGLPRELGVVGSPSSGPRQPTQEAAGTRHQIRTVAWHRRAP